MEYQKILNLLDDKMNQPCKFRRRNSIEINDESRGDYNYDDKKNNNTDNSNNNIKFKTSMIM